MRFKVEHKLSKDRPNQFTIGSIALRELMSHKTDATNFLKAMAHNGRLNILCSLMIGEKTVTEISEEFSFRQSAASQQIARLRLEGLIEGRREGKAIYYRIADERTYRVVELLHELFCSGELHN